MVPCAASSSSSSASGSSSYHSPMAAASASASTPTPTPTPTTLADLGITSSEALIKLLKSDPSQSSSSSSSSSSLAIKVQAARIAWECEDEDGGMFARRAETLLDWTLTTLCKPVRRAWARERVKNAGSKAAEATSVVEDGDEDEDALLQLWLLLQRILPTLNTRTATCILAPHPLLRLMRTTLHQLLLHCDSSSSQRIDAVLSGLAAVMQRAHPHAHTDIDALSDAMIALLRFARQHLSQSQSIDDKTSTSTSSQTATAACHADTHAHAHVHVSCLLTSLHRASRSACDAIVGTAIAKKLSAHFVQHAVGHYAAVTRLVDQLPATPTKHGLQAALSQLALDNLFSLHQLAQVSLAKAQEHVHPHPHPHPHTLEALFAALDTDAAEREDALHILPQLLYQLHQQLSRHRALLFPITHTHPSSSIATTIATASSLESQRKQQRAIELQAFLIPAQALINRTPDASLRAKACAQLLQQVQHLRIYARGAMQCKAHFAAVASALVDDLSAMMHGGAAHTIDALSIMYALDDHILSPLLSRALVCVARAPQATAASDAGQAFLQALIRAAQSQRSVSQLVELCFQAAVAAVEHGSLEEVLGGPLFSASIMASLCTSVAVFLPPDHVIHVLQHVNARLAALSDHAQHESSSSAAAAVVTLRLASSIILHIHLPEPLRHQTDAQLCLVLDSIVGKTEGRGIEALAESLHLHRAVDLRLRSGRDLSEVAHTEDGDGDDDDGDDGTAHAFRSITRHRRTFESACARICKIIATATGTATTALLLSFVKLALYFATIHDAHAPPSDHLDFAIERVMQLCSGGSDDAALASTAQDRLACQAAVVWELSEAFDVFAPRHALVQFCKKCLLPAWHAHAIGADESRSPLHYLARDAAFLELANWRQAILVAVQSENDAVVLALDLLPMAYFDIDLKRSLLVSSLGLAASLQRSDSTNAAPILLRFQTRLLQSLSAELPSHAVHQELREQLVEAAKRALSAPFAGASESGRLISAFATSFVNWASSAAPNQQSEWWSILAQFLQGARDAEQVASSPASQLQCASARAAVLAAFTERAGEHRRAPSGEIIAVLQDQLPGTMQDDVWSITHSLAHQAAAQAAQQMLQLRLRLQLSHHLQTSPSSLPESSAATLLERKTVESICTAFTGDLALQYHLLQRGPEGTLQMAQRHWMALLGTVNLYIDTLPLVLLSPIMHLVQNVVSTRAMLLRLADVSLLLTIISKLIGPRSRLRQAHEEAFVPSSAIFKSITTTLGALCRLRNDLISCALPHLMVVLIRLVSLFGQARAEVAPAHLHKVTQNSPAWLDILQSPLDERDAQSMARLLTTLTTKSHPANGGTGSGSSATSKKRKRSAPSKSTSLAQAFSKYAPHVLAAHIRSLIHPATYVSARCRTELKPGLYALCEMMGRHERDSLMLSDMDQAQRSILKTIWGDWESQRYRGE
ncbi:Nucleolar 27S pre-rRNA processing, Urb2/Npa2, C-terminal [Ceraceosorus bombacis]|uniref:Nucleolar 27S pre-rRNA processing, Urb2/Npa2, C-terminal n=1 Tax=Ceraceosorus bombacis TaxID=401625 RepID=A0A0P1BBP6_9BASI|nr:Nucleolar 27S pre-rRNA processing, Urb2/Npa2, C-terminal [Ceraceosorus bombacis]